MSAIYLPHVDLKETIKTILVFKKKGGGAWETVCFLFIISQISDKFLSLASGKPSAAGSPQLLRLSRHQLRVSNILRANVNFAFCVST